MKITYKILWLDDQINLFIEDELVQELEDFLRDEGFTPSIQTASTSAEFFEQLNGTYDLILTDYHMDGLNGDKVVKQMRDSELMTEVLFYTARAKLSDGNNLSRVTFLETSRKTGDHQQVVLEEAKNLIKMTIQKFQHIVAMRGMIMHETSSLDTQMIETLKEFINQPENKKHVQDIAEIVLAEMESHFSRKLNDIQKWRENKNLNRASKDTFAFSAAYKIKTMSAILELFNIEDFSDDYNQEIIQIRNKFAHAILETDTDGRQYFKQGDLTFDENLCRTIRKDITKHDTNLMSLRTRVESGQV